MENHGGFAISGQGALLFAETLDDVIRTIQDVPLRSVRLNTRPFAAGGMRVVHRMFDTPPKKKNLDIQDLDLVAKQTFSFQTGECADVGKMLSINKLFLEMHSFAKSCARAFNEELQLTNKV